MAAKKKTGTRKPARNPAATDPRLDDVCFYWKMLSETQRDRLYNVVATLATNNEKTDDTKEEDMPRVVLYDPRTKKMQ
jgi:hypothetical protein